MGIIIREEDINLLIKALDAYEEKDKEVIRFFEELEKQIKSRQSRELAYYKAEADKHKTDTEERELKKLDICYDYVHEEDGVRREFVYGIRTEHRGRDDIETVDSGVVLREEYFTSDAYIIEYEGKQRRRSEIEQGMNSINDEINRNQGFPLFNTRDKAARRSKLEEEYNRLQQEYSETETKESEDRFYRLITMMTPEDKAKVLETMRRIRDEYETRSQLEEQGWDWRDNNFAGHGGYENIIARLYGEYMEKVLADEGIDIDRVYERINQMISSASDYDRYDDPKQVDGIRKELIKYFMEHSYRDYENAKIEARKERMQDDGNDETRRINDMTIDELMQLENELEKQIEENGNLEGLDEETKRRLVLQRVRSKLGILKILKERGRHDKEELDSTTGVDRNEE